MDDLDLHPRNAKQLLERYQYHPEKAVVLSADSGDPFYDKNAVLYGKATIQAGVGPYENQKAILGPQHIAKVGPYLEKSGLAVHDGEILQDDSAWQNQRSAAEFSDDLDGHGYDQWKLREPHENYVDPNQFWQCPDCGFPNGYDDEVCPSCQTPRPAHMVEPPEDFGMQEPYSEWHSASVKVAEYQKVANQWIRHLDNGRWAIIQKGTGKVLSTHDSQEKAEAAFRAMEMHKHEGKEHWIQDAVKRPGQLHEDLGVPEDEKIPEDKLEEAEHSKNKKVRERAQFAENMKNMKKGAEDSDHHWKCPECGEENYSYSPCKNCGHEAPEGEKMASSKDDATRARKDRTEDEEKAAERRKKYREEKNRDDFGRFSPKEEPEVPERVKTACKDCGCDSGSCNGNCSCGSDCKVCKSGKATKSAILPSFVPISSFIVMADPEVLPAPPPQPQTPDGQDFNNYDAVDQMSVEQKRGFQNWVNTAVDYLNESTMAGVEPDIDSIIAKLSHDGCPDPQKAVMVAMQQPVDENGLRQPPPTQEPIPPQGVGQGPETGPPPAVNNEVTMPSEPVSNGAFAHVETPSGRLGHVVERYEDMWGTSWVKVSMAEGGYEDHLAEEVKEATAPKISDPVSELEQFIASWQELDGTPQSVRDRLANLRAAKQFIRRHMRNPRLTHKAAKRLDEIDAECQYALLSLGSAVIEDTEKEMKYLNAQPKFAVSINEGDQQPTLWGAMDVNLPQPSIVSPEFVQRVADEHPELVVDEMNDEVASDPQAIEVIASKYIDQYTHGYADEFRDAHRARFVEAVKKAAAKRTPKADTIEEPPTIEIGRLEQLFS